MATCVVCQTAAIVYCENDKAFLCGDCDHKIHTASVVAARHTRCRLCELCNGMVATVYCRNDKVHLCDDCDAEVHQNNPLSATHTIVPAQPLGAEQTQPAPTLASGCNHPHHAHGATNNRGSKEEMMIDEAHSETAKVAVLSPEADATTSNGASDAVVPVVPVMVEDGDEAAFLSYPSQLQQQGATMDGKQGATMDAKPWAKDFDALELDGGWLDRLEMGFDFSDILDSHPQHVSGAPGDDAGLVPTLAPSAGAAFPSDSFSEVPDVGPVTLSEGGGRDSGGSSSLKRSATFDLDDFMPSLKVPFSGPPSSAPSYNFDLALLPNDLHEASSGLQQFQQVQQQQAAIAAPSAAAALPVATRAVLAAAAAAEVTSLPVPAHVPAHAAGALTHPMLTREQRVQRYREKRSRRNFEKTIRYASRKAYAEVRPRIKGRFARKEEVLAWQAANPGLAVPEILG